jgi:hypothetical protein
MGSGALAVTVCDASGGRVQRLFHPGRYKRCTDFGSAVTLRIARL